MNPVPSVASEAINARWSALSMLPSNHGFEFGAEVVHEYIGLVWYAVRGWM
jgi:hypothetical protein